MGQASGLSRGRIWPWAGGCDGWGVPVAAMPMWSGRGGPVPDAGPGLTAGGCLCWRGEMPLPGVFRLVSPCTAALAAASAFPGQIKISEGDGKRSGELLILSAPNSLSLPYKSLRLAAGVSQRRSSTLLSCPVFWFFFYFFYLFPFPFFFLFKSNPQRQPCPCYAPLPAPGAPGAAWPPALDQLLPEKGFFFSFNSAPPG